MADKSIKLNIAIIVIIALVFIGFSYTGIFIFEVMGKYIYDAGIRYSHSEARKTDEIVLINIDDESLTSIGPWPWPRQLLAEMIDRLKDNNVKVIGLNIPLQGRELNQGLTEIKTFREKFDANPLAQKNIPLKSWVLKNLDQLEKTLDNDRRLSNSIEQSNNVVLLLSRSPDGIKNKMSRESSSVLSKNFLTSVKISSAHKEKITLDNVALPFMDISMRSSGVGYDIQPADKIMEGRSHPVLLCYNESPLPSFPLRLAIAYYDKQPREIIADETRINLKENTLALIKGEMLVNFADSQQDFTSFSFADLLNGKDMNQLLAGKIAIIGFNHIDARTFNTPISPNMKEQELTANILATILSGNTIARPSYLLYIEMALILLLGLISSVLIPRKTLLFQLVWTVVLIAIALTAGIALLSIKGIWFKPAYVVCFLTAAFIFSFFINILSSEKFSKEAYEASKLLGLSFQNQGLLDLAMDKFRKLPLNNETKDLIYNLGLEFEKKQDITNAVSVFEYINKGKGFRDLNDRISRLRSSDNDSIPGSRDSSGETDIALDSDTGMRSKVGRYAILGELGKGSMGIVYKAQDPKINRLVAIKTIRFSDEFDEDVIQEIKERFFREAEIAGQLSHPSIVTIHDVGEDRELTYMAMEFLEGEDLDKFIVKENLLPFRKVLDIVTRVAEALDFAHNAEVIHRDIKPANVMLLNSGQVKVTDFGIAKAISSSRTKTGVILGTPNYMSPEQIMGQKIDSKSDIFSLGVLFFQLITGELPFHGDNLSNLLYQITQVEHPSPKRFNPKIPKICEQILNKALAKTPANRFNTAGEFAKIVKALGSKIDQLKKSKDVKK
ncbi:CHASE2 domain-containing serine/threonine-protein kinase [Thermodesulfobacteriota bacterium]